MPYQPAGNSGSGSKTAKMSQLKFWNKQNSNKQQEKQLQQQDSLGDNLDGSNSIINGNGSSNNSSSSNNGSTGNSKSDAKNGKRNWLHTPEQLINGHAVYLVKFFGNLSVDQPKGIEVVKEAIRKLQFAQQMRKAETGTQEKFKKLEITISIKGVAIQEPRTHKILHQFPLYNISYCADEKGVKKFFSFIAKTVKNKDNGNGIQDTSNGYGNGSSSSTNTTKSEESHECFVFISNKLASDITLTIGQAFDLAYRKFMDSNEKTNLNKAQQQIEHLQQTIAIYKERLRELSAKLPKAELDAMLFKLGIKDIAEAPANEPINNGNETLSNGKLDEDKLLIDTNSTTASTHSASPSSFLPIVPPRSNLSSQLSSSSGGGGGGGGGGKSNSQKMDELLLNSDSDSDFDPRADEIQDNLSNGRNAISNDLFGFEPSKSFGQQLFFTNNNDHKLQNNNNSNLSINNNNNNANNMSINSSGFSSELNITPPLLAPPPKIAAPRRTISQSSSGNNTGLNGNTDLFGSDPFEMNNGPSVFKSQLNIDDFSLESLDPLRK